MSVVVINAVTVPDEGREEFERRFAESGGHVAAAPGFEAFELMRPSEGGRYLVVTRWASREAFDAWRTSPAFAEGHRGMRSGPPIATESELWVLDLIQSVYA